MSRISNIQRDVFRNAQEHGWWDDLLTGEAPDTVTILSKLALVHSEISEAVEEVRKGRMGICFAGNGNPKPEGMVVELADAVIRILDLCEACGLDLENALDRKHIYNQSRPYRHGGKLA